MRTNSLSNAVLFLVCVLVSVGFVAAVFGKNGGNVTVAKKRNGRVFSLFSIVSFSNGACQSTLTGSGNSGNRNGTCFTSSECTTRGGSMQGSCASGFGVCCVFVVMDPTGAVNQNGSYIQNPGYPSALSTTSSLTYTINKNAPNVCYLRLDFDTFTLRGPADTLETLGGVCSDTFIVTQSTGQRIPTICGQNSGQHIYVDIGAQNNDVATLAFTFVNASTVRMWDIKVTHIPCSSPSAPPRGCLQYHVGLTGRITTFNFLDAIGSSHLANQLYSVCIRQEAGFCCNQYQVCPDPNAFSLDRSMAAGAAAANIDSQCTQDWIQILGSVSQCQIAIGGAPTIEKYCGGVFSAFSTAMVSSFTCDCSVPFEIGIHTNSAVETSSIALPNRGVCLQYMQLPCN